MEQTKQYEYVDLGLPSGLKWAKCNVGATSETDYGDYFQWGSTEPNTADECNWADAPFNNGSDSYNEEYFTTHKSEWLDSKDNLKPEFDAARAIMGGDWRMPTKAEIQELLDYTSNKWTRVNGVYGRKFTGSNGNSIFIPAADFRLGSSFYGREDYSGDIWSSSLFTSRPKNAWYLNFFSDDFYVDYADRNYGLMVRGVYENLL